MSKSFKGYAVTKAELIEALNGLSPDCQLQFWPFHALVAWSLVNHCLMQMSYRAL